MTTNKTTSTRGSSEQPTPDKKKPVATAYFLIEGRDAEEKSQWLEAGAVWENSDGSFALELKTEPIAWRNINVRRQIQIRFREAR